MREEFSLCTILFWITLYPIVDDKKQNCFLRESAQAKQGELPECRMRRREFFMKGEAGLKARVGKGAAAGAPAREEPGEDRAAFFK